MGKSCKKCNTVKDLCEFYSDKRTKDKYMGVCKVCYNLRMKEYIERYPEKRKLTTKKHNDKTKDKRKDYYNNNKETIIEKHRTYYQNVVKPNITEDDKLKNRLRIYEYRKKNKEKIKEQRRKYDRLRRKNDELYRLKDSIRSLIRSSFKNRNLKKDNSTTQILGCTFEEFKKHLESQFEPWMNWDNRGKYNGEPNFGWDIDHVIPTSSAKTLEEVLQLNHYSNLKPLCSKVNRYIKRDNIH